jgi:hypothetical protein
MPSFTDQYKIKLDLEFVMFETYLKGFNIESFWAKTSLAQPNFMQNALNETPL